MEFRELAEYFEKVEQTSSRLEIIGILFELFEKTDSDSIKKVIYLCQSELGPGFDKIETGMGEKYIEDAIAKTTGYAKDKVSKMYLDKGDLGLVAEELAAKKKQSALFSQSLGIEKVFQNFLKIAKMEGTGSQSSRIKLLAELLNSASPIEARYLARIPLKNLRLGTGDPTLMDALANSFVDELKKNKKLAEEIKKNVRVKETKDTFEEELNKKIRAYAREKIESKFNIYPDLGTIAELLKKEGLKGLDKIKIIPGIPIRPALAERLSSAEEITEKLGECAVEGKYDGFRLQIHKNKNNVKIFSRQMEDMTHMFPDLIESIKKQVNASQTIFEGEALAYNEQSQEFYPFQVTITRKRKYGIDKAKEELPLRLFVFDVLFLNGKNVMKKPFRERRKLLEKMISKGEEIKLTETIITDNPKELNLFFEKTIEKGLEGIIAKDLNAPYTVGARKFAWIKLKRSYKGELNDTVDLVIIGYFKGRGKRTQFGLGALLTACYDDVSDTFKSIAKIGTGLTEEMLVHLEKELSKIKKEKRPARIDSKLEPDFWVEPRIVIEVNADEITKSPTHTCGKRDKEGYALRFPRMKQIREKKAEEATTEAEIISMYKKQGTIGME